MQERNGVITDIQIPFWSLVGFLIKVSLAAIPAGIVLALVGALFTSIFGVGLLGLLS